MPSARAWLATRPAAGCKGTLVTAGFPQAPQNRWFGWSGAWQYVQNIARLPNENEFPV